MSAFIDLGTCSTAHWLDLYLPPYGIVILAVIGLTVPLMFKPRRCALGVAAACVNLAAAVPAFFLIRMRVVGASPTVQFNAGSRAAMDAWSAWANQWPGFVLLLFICGVASLGLLTTYIGTHARWAMLVKTKLLLFYLLFTIAHCLAALYWIMSNFPSA